MVENNMTTYLFPGQGSQAKGMGEDLFNAFPEWVKKADAILGYSIAELCLEDPREQLNETDFTQPALYVVNALAYLQRLQETSQKPDYLAGHSLGEYNALFAAGVMDFETGLKLVQKRGALMRQAMGGGMAAVIGLPLSAIKGVLAEANLTTFSVANYNSFSQFVLSGTAEAIASSEAIFKQAGAKLYKPLKVSGAFHSSFMDQAQREFAAFIAGFHFNPPEIPVIANVDALPYAANTITNNLTKQINHPVLWTQSMEYLLQKGETDFVEIGPGKVLAGLIGRIQKGQ